MASRMEPDDLSIRFVPYLFAAVRLDRFWLGIDVAVRSRRIRTVQHFLRLFILCKIEKRK